MLTQSLALLSFLVSAANAQAPTLTFPATPLASKHFTYPSGIPYRVDTDTNLIRGQQAGYNLCNSTTEGPNSLCQTSFANGIDDFCLWAPAEPNSTVADKEGEMVAWCTKPGRGTRLIPGGALTGLQVLKTPNFLQFVGFINQELINLQPGDFGGEMDPHGADLRGNPMGGILFSTNFTGQEDQVIEWTNFMGGGAFCLKVCDPKGPNAAQWCQHIYDRIGCTYNAPNAAQNGTFEECQAEDGDFPGVFTSNGAVVTYTQPPESLGAIQTVPYTARVPSSSNCVTHASAQLFAALPSPTTLSPASAAVVTSTGSNGAIITSTVASPTRSGSAAGASNTSNGAASVKISGISVLGVAFAALFLS